MYHDYGGWHMAMGWGWGWGWWLICAAVAAVFLWALFRVWREPYASSHRSSGPSSEETLGRRYAKGEISRDTYLQMREDLRH